MADDQQQPPDPQGDQPRSAGGPPAGPPGPDETRRFPAVPPDDETSVLPTSGQPRSGDTTIQPPVPAWSGRAGVPPPEAFGRGETVPAYEEPPPGRPWWMPVLLGLLALALFALLGVGLWLITRADDSAPQTPAVTAPAPATQSFQTSPAPSPSATSQLTRSAPVQVVVPPLVGTDGSTAQSTLEDLGLAVRLTSRADPSAPPGTVIETDPPAGSIVRKGSRITVVIASAPSSPSAPPTSGLPSPSPSD